MGLSFVRIFVRGSEPTTLEHALDHFDYVRDLVGMEHIGIGSDADVDGYDVLPEESTSPGCVRSAAANIGGARRSTPTA